MFNFKPTEVESRIIETLRNDPLFTEGNQCFTIENRGLKGSMNFYGDNLVELEIRKEDEIVFYLQFEMISRTQSQECMNSFFSYLFGSTEEKGQNYATQEVHSILFVCTCGVTSRVLEEMCRKYAEEKELDISFSSVAISNLDMVADQFDVIGFLPQIAYALRRQEFPFKDKISVLRAMDVATRDIESIIEFMTKQVGE